MFATRCVETLGIPSTRLISTRSRWSTIPSRGS